MKKSFLVVLLLFAAAMATAGCSRSTCEQIEDACGGGDDAVDQCMDDYQDGNAECKKAMRHWADCVDDQGCADVNCVDESVDVLDEC